MRRLLPTFLALVAIAGPALAGDVFLGITMDDLTPSMARALQLDDERGVLINEIVDDSPAAAAGLQAGDVILKFGDREIKGTSSLSRVIHSYDPGDEVSIEILREGKNKKLDVTLGEREGKHRVIEIGGKKGSSWSWVSGDDDGDTRVFSWKGDGGDDEIVISGLEMLGGDRGFLGIEPGTDDPDELRELGAPDGAGVLVNGVYDGSGAAEAGLEEGDVIVALDGKDIADREDLHDILADTEPGQTMAVRVIRDGQGRDFEVTLGESVTALDLGNKLKMIMPGDPDHPRSPRFYEFHSGQMPTVMELEKLEQERQDMAELKDELADLKEELKKLRKELKEQR